MTVLVQRGALLVPGGWQPATASSDCGGWRGRRLDDREHEQALESEQMTQTAASDVCPAPSEEAKTARDRGHRATTPQLLVCGWEGLWVCGAVISLYTLGAVLTSSWCYNRAMQHRAVTP